MHNLYNQLSETILKGWLYFMGIVDRVVDYVKKQVGYGVVGDLNVLERVTVSNYYSEYREDDIINSLKRIQENLLMSDELKSLKSYGKSKIKNQNEFIKSYFDTQKALNKCMDSLIQSLEKANVEESFCRKKYKELKEISSSESVSENWYSELNSEYKKKVLNLLRKKMESEKEQLKKSVLDYFKKLGLTKNIENIESEVFKTKRVFEEEAKNIISEYIIKPKSEKLVEKISKNEGKNFEHCYCLPYGDKKRKKLEDDIIKKISTEWMKKDFIKNLKKNLFSKNIGINDYEWILYNSIFEYFEKNITFGRNYKIADESYGNYFSIDLWHNDDSRILKNGLKRYSGDTDLKKLSDEMFKKQKEMSQKFEKSPERIKKSFEYLLEKLNSERDYYRCALGEIDPIENKINDFFKPINTTTYYQNFVKKVMTEGFKNNNFTSGEVFGYIYYVLDKKVKVKLKENIENIKKISGNVDEQIKKLSSKPKDEAKKEESGSKEILNIFSGWFSS